MKHLLKRSYQAIVNRGLVDKDTLDYNFMDKVSEEHKELINAFYFESMDRRTEELIDLITVCLTWLTHDGIDFEKEFIKGIERNEKRKVNN